LILSLVIVSPEYMGLCSCESLFPDILELRAHLIFNLLNGNLQQLGQLDTEGEERNKHKYILNTGKEDKQRRIHV
jgi:hypothetical protein